MTALSTYRVHTYMYDLVREEKVGIPKVPCSMDLGKKRFVHFRKKKH